MDAELSPTQAYKAMFTFVREYYYRTGRPDDIGNLLSDIQLLSHLYEDPQREGSAGRLSTADPASWEDWLRAVNQVLENQDEE